MGIWTAIKVGWSILTGSGAADFLKDAGILLFAWKVIVTVAGDAFYRYVTLIGLGLAVAVTIGHFIKGGKLAKFKVYRGIGLMLTIIATFATVVGLSMAAVETVAAKLDKYRAPDHRRLQDDKPKKTPWFLDNTING